jgi:predicted O-linked N-acetylglucosamine transferase (SPINDLY family)
MPTPVTRVSPAAAGYLQRARKALAQGQFVPCLQACEMVLRTAPSNHEALSLCGQAHLKLGQIDEAIVCLQKRLELDLSNAQVAEDIATLLMHGRNYQDALPYLKHCEALRGWTEDIAYSIGFCHQELGNRSVALEILQRVLERNPKMIDAYSRTALLLYDMGRRKEAVEFLDLGLSINRDSIALLHCQGKLLTFQGLFSTALQKFERLEELKDRDIEHRIDHAELLARMRRGSSSEAKYQEILRSDPSNRRAMTLYGVLLSALKRNEDALPLFEKIIKRYPDDAATWFNLGNIYGSQRNFLKSYDCFQKSYALRPQGAEVAGAYLYTMSFICDWREHEKVLGTIESDTGFTTSRCFPSVIFENNPVANLAYARSSIEKKFSPTHILGDLKSYGRHEKIRIGYYSSDFYHHATVMLIEGMLREHDRSRFELYAFSLDFAKQDGYTDRVRGLFDHYHDVSRLSDGAVALLSRQLEIDIAIDLKGFTEGSRTGIFAERAAPVQINYLGFPGSMGAPYIDYMVADHYTVTPEIRQYFDEKIIYMPDCYQPNNPERPSAGQGSDRPAELPDSKFVFCSFNNTYKLTPKVFDLWMRILKQAPDSVLWMLKTTEQAEANLLAHIKASGMDPQRVVFAPLLVEADHLKRFVHADLFMDSFPCNAHTTASDALWAGVPIITRSGQTFASRVAGSILQTVGLQELIVDSEEAYEALALKIYHDRAYHQQLKQRVKDGIAHGPLYNAETYTGHFERALIEVYERQREGAEPQDLDVAQLQSAALA